MIQTVTNGNIDVREDNIEAENKEDSLGKEEQKAKFIHLRAKGYSFAKIAKELGVSKSTLSNWSQELEEQIARAKAMELEALQEEYYILKEGRIKLLGEQLRAIQKELSPTSAVLRKIIFFIIFFMSPCAMIAQKDIFVFPGQATTTPNSM